MSTDRRRRYVVQMWDQATGDQYQYGPYTERQAEAVAEKIARFYSGEYEPEQQPIVTPMILTRWEDAG